MRKIELNETDKKTYDKLEGSVDIRALAKLLPEIEDVTRFVSAVQKVRNAKVDDLSRMEVRQLAMAFVSILDDDSDTRTKAIRKLSGLHKKKPTAF